MRYKRIEGLAKTCRRDIPNMTYGQFSYLMLKQPRYMQAGTRHKMTYYEI